MFIKILTRFVFHCAFYDMTIFKMTVFETLGFSGEFSFKHQQGLIIDRVEIHKPRNKSVTVKAGAACIDKHGKEFF